MAKEHLRLLYAGWAPPALADHMRHFKGGRVVLNVVEMPIKCPVAPLEFVFLADWFFTKEGIRDKTEIVYATPLEGAFTKPKASALLGDMLEERNIKVQTYLEHRRGPSGPERHGHLGRGRDGL